MRVNYCWALVASVLLSWAATASARSDAQWFPEETVLYLSIPNAPKARKDFAASSISALWNDLKLRDDLRDFLSGVNGTASKGIVRQILRTHPTKLLRLVDGRISVSCSDISVADLASGRFPSLVLVADIGGNGKAVRQWFSNAETAFGNSTHRRITEVYKSAEIVRYRARTPRSGRVSVCWTIDGHYLLAADSLAGLHAVLDRRRSTGKGGLSSQARFQTVHRQLGGGDVECFCDLSRIWQSVDDALGTSSRLYDLADQEGMKGGPWGRLVSGLFLGRAGLRLLGINQVEAAGLNVSFRSKGAIARTYLLAPGSRTGLLCRLLSGPSAELVPPKAVPPGAPMCTMLDFDPARAWLEARSAADHALPGLLAMWLDGWIAQQELHLEERTDVDFSDDIVRALGHVICIYETSPKSEAAAGGKTGAVPRAAVSPAVVVACTLPDPTRFSATLSNLYASPSSAMKSTKYLGTTVWTARHGGATLAVVGGHLFASFQVGAVRDAILAYHRAGPSLGATGRYLSAIVGLPKKCRILSYATGEETSRILQATVVGSSDPAGAKPPSKRVEILVRILKAVFGHVDAWATAETSDSHGIRTTTNVVMKRGK